MSVKDWKTIDIDRILNEETASTRDNARYSRIMTHLNTRALNGVSETIHKASEKSENMFTEYKISQEKHDRIMRRLTIAIAVATALYTGITAWSVWTMKESNQIQAELLKLEKRKVPGEITSQ